MANTTSFTVNRGEVMSDCMRDTYEFIQENLEFFYHSLQPVREVLAANETFSFISHEDRWSFACSVEKVELGMVSQGAGVIREGGSMPYDEVIAHLDLNKAKS